MKSSKTKPIAAATQLEQALTLAVASLEEGEVVSYGDIATRAGRPDAPRAAGALLSKAIATLPWWRVVYASGKLAPCNPVLQQEKLEEEGVVVKNGRVAQSPLGRFADE
jgi:methylated-DNA-protein-cysteine methyltransferase-like protein